MRNVFVNRQRWPVNVFVYGPAPYLLRHCIPRQMWSLWAKPRISTHFRTAPAYEYVCICRAHMTLINQFIK